jgi:hypothetical protein
MYTRWPLIRGTFGAALFIRCAKNAAFSGVEMARSSRITRLENVPVNLKNLRPSDCSTSILEAQLENGEVTRNISTISVRPGGSFFLSKRLICILDTSAGILLAACYWLRDWQIQYTRIFNVFARGAQLFATNSKIAIVSVRGSPFNSGINNK